MFTFQKKMKKQLGFWLISLLLADIMNVTVIKLIKTHRQMTTLPILTFFVSR